VIQTVHLRDKPIQFNYLTAEIVEILNTAATWSWRTGVTVWLTSLNDHEHGDSSLHYYDYAVDFDTREAGDLQRLYRYLRDKLDHRFDVVFEGNHVHVEFELGKPKSGRN